MSVNTKILIAISLLPNNCVHNKKQMYQLVHLSEESLHLKVPAMCRLLKLAGIRGSRERNYITNIRHTR